MLDIYKASAGAGKTFALTLEYFRTIFASPAEYKKIVDYVLANPSPRNLGILLTICSGMRIGEVCALQWKDIDLDKKTIHICKT